jgi:uncharacterized membrane protein YozB (DUF420 family)
MTTKPRNPWRSLQRLAVSTLVLLVLEYVAGMWLNIYTGSSTDGGAAPEVKNSPVLIIHVLISIALLVHAIIMLVLASKNKIKNWTIISIISLIAILLAAQQGDQFMRKESELSSFLMALAFLVAFCCYVYGIIKNLPMLPDAKDDAE